VGGFPEEFHHEVNEFRVGVSLSEKVEIGKNFGEKIEEEVPFVFGD
jgi:hypothetical protein